MCSSQWLWCASRASAARSVDEPLPDGDISGGLQSIWDELRQMGLNGIGVLEPAAARTARLLGWTDAERDGHIEDCKAIRAREMRVIT